MIENIQPVMEYLSTKFGPTAEHLWEVTLKQAPISAAINISLCSIASVLTYKFTLFVIKKTTKTDKESYSEWQQKVLINAFGARKFYKYVVPVAQLLKGK